MYSSDIDQWIIVNSFYYFICSNISISNASYFSIVFR